jgi:riboflavin kinase/FMN adenylyltransferase
VAVSSSEERKQLAAGRVERVACLLTYPYRLKGCIVHGDKIGRTIGFPTANIQIDEPFKMLPCEGVYAVEAALEEKKYRGMMYIGRRPTLGASDSEVALEVNLFDFTGDIYTKEITVSFIRYIRRDIRFRSMEELKEQLERDREIVNSVLSFT